MKRLLTIALLSLLQASPAFAGPIGAAESLVTTNFQSANLIIGGTATCAEQQIDYDAASNVLQHDGGCTETGALTGDFDFLGPVTGLESSLVGVVDNAGNAGGGAFSLVGAIPGLDIFNVSVLALGVLDSVFYGAADFPDGSTTGTQLWSLIHLTYMDSRLDGFGSYLLWRSSTQIDGWSPPELAWTVSGTSNSAFTGPEWRFYDETAIRVSEPSGLVLFLMGLVGLVLVRYRRRSNRSQRPYPSGRWNTLVARRN